MYAYGTCVHTHSMLTYSKVIIPMYTVMGNSHQYVHTFTDTNIVY